MVFLAIIFQNALLMALIVGLLVAPAMGRAPAIALVIAAISLFAGSLLAGVWLYPPVWGSWVFGAGLLVASWRLLKKARARPRKRSFAALIIAALVSGVGGLLVYQGLIGRIPPSEEAIELASPLLVNEGYCALSAGASLALNLHYVEGEKTAASYEKHSVDFTRQIPSGFRTIADKFWHPKPVDPAAYAVFGADVRAPCSGTVIQSVDGKPDQPAGHRYRSLDGANIITLQCTGADVVLAHFKRGTVAAEEGELVKAGQILGQVGNSGNTEEPHLHINAQRERDDGTIEPVPMRFNGRIYGPRRLSVVCGS